MSRSPRSVGRSAAIWRTAKRFNSIAQGLASHPGNRNLVAPAPQRGATAVLHPVGVRNLGSSASQGALGDPGLWS